MMDADTEANSLHQGWSAMEDTNVIDLTARYAVAGYSGVAFAIKGYAQTWEPCTALMIDPETGEEVEVDTEEGEWIDDPLHVIAIMVGDDREHTVSVDDLTPLPDDAYCGVCGQIGCQHDGRPTE